MRELRDERRVTAVDDERPEPGRVGGGDADGRDGQAAGAHELAGRAAHGGAAYDRAHRGDAAARGGQRVRDTGDGEHRADRRHGVRRADDDQLGLTDRLEHARSRTGRSGPRVLDVEDLDLRFLAYEVLLKRKPAIRLADTRAHGRVAHG